MRTRKNFEETKVKMKYEMFPQLFVHVIDEIPTKTFMRNLANGEKFQNWKAEHVPFVFKK